VAHARIAPIDGTSAMRSPESELEMRRSASDRKNHGAATSTKVYATIHLQWGSSGPRSFRTKAIGRRSPAPTAVRRRTRLAGDSSLTAILMKRYGMP